MDQRFKIYQKIEVLTLDSQCLLYLNLNSISNNIMPTEHGIWKNRNKYVYSQHLDYLSRSKYLYTIHAILEDTYF